MLLGLDFMPSDQIGHMSLNDLRRQVSTCDKTKTETRMHELLVALDLEHQVSASGSPYSPMLSFCRSKNCLLEYLRH
jgi:hypothetical protein